MSGKKSQRKRIFVNCRIQGSVLLRLIGYWAVYHFVLWHSLFLFEFMRYRVEMLNGGPLMTFSELYAAFFWKYYPMLLAAVTILPLFLYDSIRTTHRIAGPLLRFKNTLKRLRNGEHIESIQLRKGDLLIDFQNEFNEFLKFYNAQLEARSAPGPADSDASQEAQIHEQINAISAELAHQREASASFESVELPTEHSRTL